MSAIGELIRRHRQQARLSQSDLAGEEFSASYVSLIESGKRQPSEDALQAFAHRLGCSVDDLRGDTLDEGPTLDLELSYVRLALVNGELVAARQRLETVLARTGTNRRVEHEARLLLAEVHERDDDLAAALRILKPLYDLCLAGRSELPVTVVAVSLCRCCIRVGDFDAAVRFAERGLQVSREAGLRPTEDHLKLQANLVAAYVELGDQAVALTVADELLTAAESIGSSFAQAAAYWNAALAAESRGQVHEALRLSQRALGLMSEQGTSRNLLRLQFSVAWLILCADPDRAWNAATLLDQAVAGLGELGGAADLGTWESNRSVAHLLVGEVSRAEHLARRALLHLGDAGDPLEAVQARLTIGDALMAGGQREAAVMNYLSAVDMLDQAPAGWKNASLYRGVAYRLSLLDDVVGAARLLEKALDAAGIKAHTGPADVAFGIRGFVPASGSGHGTGLDAVPGSVHDPS